MKSTALIIFSFFISAMSFGQVSPPKDENVQGVVVKKEYINKLDSSNSQLEQAEKAYQNALSEQQKARENLVDKNNALESARTALRQAQITARQADKLANPVIIERYDPIINAVYAEMSKGSQYGLATYIEGTETSGFLDVLSKDVDKEFKSYLKQFNTDKVKKKKGELLFDNIHIPEMSTSTMDVYVDFVDHENGVNIHTFFDMGPEFLNTNDENNPSVQYAHRLMEHFARYIRKNTLEEEVKGLEEAIDHRRDDVADAKKEIAESREDIQNNEAKINEMYHRISQLEPDIDALSDRLEESREKLSKVE